MYGGSQNSLFANLPASIQIEEMLLGRLTFRQFIILLLGSYVSYQTYITFKVSVITLLVMLLSGLVVYFAGFFKIKKYDRYITEHIYNKFMFKSRTQVYIPKKD